MFLYPVLLTALGLIALPILIHLINLFRYRRVEWAAMEFLLASYRKHSTWIRMRELLLLLCRIGIVSLVVLAAAQPLVSDQWGRLLSGQKSNLLFILDDSYSMQARTGDSTCFQQAKSVIQQYFTDHAVTPGQTVTLITFSRPDSPILSSVAVDANFGEMLTKTLKTVFASQRDDNPIQAVRTAADLVQANPNNSHRVFLVSDFRANNWLTREGKLNAELQQEIGRLTDNKASVAIMDVSGQSGEAEDSSISASNDKINLGIASIKPGDGTIAAGVPIPMVVEVINHSTVPVKNLSVRLEADGKSLPAVMIPVIQGRETGRAHFSVSFPQGGSHLVEAILAPDALETDNSRFCVLNVPARISVLLVGSQPRDGSELPSSQQPDVKFIQTVLEPGSPVDTGISCKVEDARFLNTADLNTYKTVYLLNVRQFSSLAGENLLNWISNGGTAVVFLGDSVDISAWNGWVAKNKQLECLKLSAIKTLMPDFLRKRPDMTVLDNPIFRIFEGEKNAFLSAVMIQNYYELSNPHAVEKQVLAQLRNGAPLMVDLRVGKGSVVTMLTSAAPSWNNWGKGNPSYVVVLHQLQAMLLARETHDENFSVGHPIEFSFNGSMFKETLSCTIPPPENEAQLDEKSREIDLLAKTKGKDWSVFMPDTSRAGIYKFIFQKRLAADTDSNSSSGETDTEKNVAVNVVPEEGNLAKLDLSEFKRQWPDIPMEISDSTILDAMLAGPMGFNIQAYCLYGLGVLMFLEMLIAYWASSHLSASAVVLEKGKVR